MTIKKGTLIRMGKNPKLRSTAQGLLIRLQKDADWWQEVHADVVENPSGWRHEDIYHELNPHWDKIVHLNNKEKAEGKLERI